MYVLTDRSGEAGLIPHDHIFARPGAMSPDQWVKHVTEYDHISGNPMGSQSVGEVQVIFERAQKYLKAYEMYKEVGIKGEPLREVAVLDSYNPNPDGEEAYITYFFFKEDNNGTTYIIAG